MLNLNDDTRHASAKINSRIDNIFALVRMSRRSMHRFKIIMAMLKIPNSAENVFLGVVDRKVIWRMI